MIKLTNFLVSKRSNEVTKMAQTLDYSWIQLPPGSSWKEDLVYRYSHFHFSVIIVCWCHPTIHVSITFSDGWEITYINVVGNTTSPTGCLPRRQNKCLPVQQGEKKRNQQPMTPTIKWFDSRWHCMRATQGGSGIVGSRNTKWGEHSIWDPKGGLQWQITLHWQRSCMKCTWDGWHLD
jgi:hypothetical protein